MINFMSLELTKENMILFFPSWKKPLSDKEITDFLNTSIIKEKRMWWPEWVKDLPQHVWISSETKKYNTKKEIKQDIKIMGDQLDNLLAKKQGAPNEITIEFIDICMDELFQKRNKLKEKIRYVGVKFNNNNLEKAKQRPISDFLEFNSAGFAKCPFHQERTNSFHKLPGKEKGYCFGCGKTGDVIDVVMEINNCELQEALKIILK